MKKILFLFLITFYNLSYSFVIDKPDPSLTPGAYKQEANESFCVVGFSKTIRKVSEKTKQKIYNRYNVPLEDRGGYVTKIDHLVPLQFYGTNEESNLWPHYFNTEYGVLKKNKLENLLKKKICNGEITQIEAIKCIINDWTLCYRKYYVNK